MGVKRIIKLGLISLAALFILVTAISLLLPSTIIVSRSVNINAPADSLFNQINDLTKWHNWIANNDTLPIRIENHGKDVMLEMGNTKVQIHSSGPSQIITHWQAGGGKILPGYFNIMPSSDKVPYTTLQWQFLVRAKWYPWEKFTAAVSDKVVGPFMEKSLENLKLYMESSN